MSTSCGTGLRVCPQSSRGDGEQPAVIGQLSSSRQQLILLLQSIRFGTIGGLHVRDGEPVLQPEPRVTRDVKFGCRDESGALNALADISTLKAAHRDLLALLDRVGTGVIDLIEIRHGLPFRATVTSNSTEVAP